MVASPIKKRLASRRRGDSSKQGNGKTQPKLVTLKVKHTKAKRVGHRKIKIKPPPRINWYPADGVRKPLRSGKHKHNPTRLRKSIRPGTVIILLAGQFRGKRVVFLKQLVSGLLLVTGPYKINGVPLRRVNQAYVIATATRVDFHGIDLSTITDAFFCRSPRVIAALGTAFAKKMVAKKKREEKAAKKKEEAAEKGEEEKGKEKKKEKEKEKEKSKKPDIFDEATKRKKKVTVLRVAQQKRVDGLLLPFILHNKKYPLLKQYLNARFSLTNKTKPHLMRF